MNCPNSLPGQTNMSKILKIDEMIDVMQKLHYALVLFVTEVGDDGLNGPIPSVRLEYPVADDIRTTIVARQQIVKILRIEKIPVVSLVLTRNGQWEWALIKEYSTNNNTFIRTTADGTVQNNLEALPTFPVRMSDTPTYMTVNEILRYFYAELPDASALLQNS
jgi:hypothetical protein